MELTNVQELLARANRLEATQTERFEQYNKIHDQAVELKKEIDKMQADLQTYICGCNLLGEVSDEATQDTLDKISAVINKALGILFPKDSRTVKISKTMYRDVHPHFNVDLITENGVVRSFQQSGDGLAQVISFLFLICLIDARGGRKFLVIDEVLNGLHPNAKGIVRDLLTAVSSRFQFLVVEYGMDVHKEYELEKTNGTAVVREYEGDTYYQDIALEGIDAE